MNIKIVSVNVGAVQEQPWRGGTLSGLYKSPVEGMVTFSTNGLEGDEQADIHHHGGEDKAVFVMPADNYALFKIKQPFGFLGENLTLSGLNENTVRLGDRFQMGDVVLEVTQPRSPCWKLGQQVQSHTDWMAAQFLQTYAKGGRVGFYCRVLESGSIQQGDAAELHKDEQGIAVGALFLAKQQPKTAKNQRILKQALEHPALSQAWRDEIAAVLAR